MKHDWNTVTEFDHHALNIMRRERDKPLDEGGLFHLMSFTLEFQPKPIMK